MNARRRRSPVQERSRAERVYAPELLPRIQSLLAVLADIDFAHQKSLDTIRRSPSDQALKQAMRANLERHHETRRAPYSRELMAMQRHIASGLGEDSETRGA